MRIRLKFKFGLALFALLAVLISCASATVVTSSSSSLDIISENRGSRGSDGNLYVIQSSNEIELSGNSFSYTSFPPVTGASWNGKEIVRPSAGFPESFGSGDLIEKGGKYYVRDINYLIPPLPEIAANSTNNSDQPPTEAKKSPGTGIIPLLAIGSLFFILRKKS